MASYDEGKESERDDEGAAMIKFLFQKDDGTRKALFDKVVQGNVHFRYLVCS